MSVRTSETSPLRIAKIDFDSGSIGMTICPGKKGPSEDGDDWCRDMRIDVKAIADAGYSTILTLMEWDELGVYKAHSIKKEAASFGLKWLHFPFPDRSIPDPDQNVDWKKTNTVIHATLDAGDSVLIHCLGGLGRTGTVAAMILQDFGIACETSMSRVRAAREGTIETASQETFLYDYTTWI